MPPAWAANERGLNQRAPDLKALVKTIVDRDGYTPDSAIAFVIRGTGRRTADSFEGNASGRPPSLTVTDEPRRYTQEFLACGNPAEVAAVCGERAQSKLTSLAQQCKLANTLHLHGQDGAERRHDVVLQRVQRHLPEGRRPGQLRS
jgi:hypothetical protein